MFLLDNVQSTFVGLVGVLFLCIYKYLKKNSNYWKQKNVAFKEPVLLFGNYLDFFLMRKSTGSVYKKLYNEFPNEKLVGVYKTLNIDIMVKDPELIKHVLVKDFNFFQDRFKGLSENTEPLNMHLFNVEKNKWKIMRQKITPIFTSGKLRNMFHLILEKGDEFQRFMESVVLNGKELELRDFMAKFTTEVIGSCAFGIKMNSISDTNSEFRKMGKKVVEPSLLKSLKLLIRVLSPTIFNLLKLRLNDIEIERFFITTVKQMVQEREESGSKRHDFIDLLIALKNDKEYSNKLESDNGTQLTDMEFTDAFITAQVFIFFIAGYETSSTLMAFVLNELAFHSEIQIKVVEEIENVLKKYEGKLTYEGIKEMKYLEMVVCETQRKYPPLGVLHRVCTEKYTFPNTNVTIDKETSVVIPVLALHYDPQYYPDPKKFIPERFSPEAVSSRHPMLYLPFGEGPRNCIGLRFGKMQSKVGLVSFLSKYFVEPTARSENQVEINTKSFVTAAKNGIWLKVTPRKNKSQNISQ